MKIRHVLADEPPGRPDFPPQVAGTAAHTLVPVRNEEADAGSTGEEQWPAGSLSNEASQARPVGTVGVQRSGR